MFIYFHKNKSFKRGLSPQGTVPAIFNNKAQLLPIFIVVLAVILIMALVTINISKVAFTKTDSANGADAGALAGGSVMANTFNAMAKLNGELVAEYKTFLANVFVHFVIAEIEQSAAEGLAAAAQGSSGQAAGLACSDPCSAASSARMAATQANQAMITMGKVRSAISDVAGGILIFWYAQYEHYMIMRDKVAKPGRRSAMIIAHKFNFINSGVGAKLKEGKPPAGVVDTQDEYYNYRDSFSSFLKNKVKFDKDIEPDGSYPYKWEDGEGRTHEVISTVQVEPVINFVLQRTILNMPLELVVLFLARDAAETAIANFLAASQNYQAAAGILQTICTCLSSCSGPQAPACRTICLSFCSTATTLLSAADGQIITGLSAAATIPLYMLASWLGLFFVDGDTFLESSGNQTPDIICWVNDVRPYSYEIRVEDQQTHTGANQGLWEFKYPVTRSHCVVDFSGQGHFGEVPKLNYDASINRTDQ